MINRNGCPLNPVGLAHAHPVCLTIAASCLSEQQFLSIDQELRNIDQTLEKSIADVQAQ